MNFEDKDILRTPEEYMDDGLHKPVELVYSDRFQRIQFKEKETINN